MNPDLKQMVKDYVGESRLMQIATVREGKPWICTVHFIEDEELNLYWLSLPTRRHSQDIQANDHIAVAIAVKADMPVVGIQTEGIAKAVSDQEEIKSIMQKYVEKFSIGGAFYDNFIAGKNQHVLYKFTPENFVLFDEVTFKPDESRKEWQPKH